MAPLYGLAAIAVAAVIFGLLVLAEHARRRIREHGLLMLAWRWVAGHHHTGMPQTNATWSVPGTKALTQTGHCRSFWFKPRRERVKRRAGAVLGAMLSCWGMIFFAPAAETLLACSAAGGTCLAARKIRRAWPQRQHHRQFVQPLHLTLAPMVGHPVSVPARTWLAVEPDRSCVTIALPEGFSATERHQERIVAAAAARLGLEAPEAHWALAGAAPTLMLEASAPPPDRVDLARILPAIEAAGPDELVLGLGKNRGAVSASLHTDSPHIGASMGSGAGKSTLGRILSCQVLHKGGLLVVLDPKWLSQRWARGLPNVIQVHTVRDIHEMLCWLGGELDRRNQVGYWTSDIEGEVHGNVGPRILVMGEELNALMDDLKAYWAEIRRPGDPKKSPALASWDKLFHTGRQARMHILAIGQRLSVKAMGGNGDARESVGIRLLARYQPATWQMLAAEYPMAPSPSHLGRVQAVAGGRVRECQVAYVTGRQAADYAVSGEVALFPADVPGATMPYRLAIEQGNAGQPYHAVTVKPLPVSPAGGITLRAACENGIVPKSVTAARMDRHRHRDRWPEPVSAAPDGSDEYLPADLAKFYSSRTP